MSRKWIRRNPLGNRRKESASRQKRNTSKSPAVGRAWFIEEIKQKFRVTMTCTRLRKTAGMSQKTFSLYLQSNRESVNSFQPKSGMI